MNLSSLARQFPDYSLLADTWDHADDKGRLVKKGVGNVFFWGGGQIR